MRNATFPRADAGTLLARALVADAAGRGLTVRVCDWRSHPWASATFVGARHRALLTIEGDGAAWLADLPEVEFSLRGHLVADLAVAHPANGPVVLEALTLDHA